MVSDTLYCTHFQITNSPCLPPFSPATWTKNGFVDNSSLNATSNLNIAPKSPLFRMVNEKLKLEDKAIASFDNFNTIEQTEGSNYANSHPAIVEGDNSTLEDIKLSEFDLDFDVWNSVIDETQEDNVSMDDRFPSTIPTKLVPPTSTISSYQEQVTVKSEEGFEGTRENKETCMKMEENALDIINCKSETVGDFDTLQSYPTISSSISNLPGVMASDPLASTQNCFDNSSNDSLTSTNNFNMLQSQNNPYNSTNDIMAVSTNQHESMPHPNINQKQLHRIKVIIN